MDIILIAAIATVLIAAIVAVLIVAIAVIIRNSSSGSGTIFEAPERRAGRRGERQATYIIKQLLRDGDHLFTNVNISFDKRPAELDNVIVNTYGVFIIEVKNYNGRLVGSEDDYEWEKYHTTDAGNTYMKLVKNPIKQVKRQIHLLAHHLDHYGVKVWVNGYVFLLHGNSPVKSKFVLSSIGDIDKAIHTPGKDRLNTNTVASIVKLLS